MSANPISFLSSLTAGRQSASHFDRRDEAITSGSDFLESCPAGVRCPYRSRFQVEVNKTNSLSASNQVLSDSNKYLQSKCDVLTAENDRLRQEFAVSERSALASHSRVSKAHSDAVALTESNIAPPLWHQQFADLKDDIRQATEDKHLLVSQVGMLQDSLEKMTRMNEELLKHIKAGGSHFVSSVVGQNGHSRTSSRATSPAQPTQHKTENSNERKNRSMSAVANSWGAAMASHNVEEQNDNATYLFGGHKGYPADIIASIATPLRHGPRDAANVTGYEQPLNQSAARGLTSDMNGVDTVELMMQQKLEKEKFLSEQSNANKHTPSRSLPMTSMLNSLKPRSTAETHSAEKIAPAQRSKSELSETSALVKPMIEPLKVLDGVLPPQQLTHYRIRDGSSIRDSNARLPTIDTDEVGLNESFRSSSTDVGRRANSARRPSRATNAPPKAHDSAVPKEGIDNVYSKLRQESPIDQGAPFIRGPGGRPTTPNRDGGNNNPLWGGASPPRGTRSTTPIAQIPKPKPIELSKSTESETIRATTQAKPTVEGINELQQLQNHQEELLRKESSVRPKPDLTEDDEVKRQPRRTDSALLATRLVKKERVVFLRIPGRELYLEMLLKDAAGITRRTFGSNQLKGLGDVWSCYFKK